jgi:hypothetical protein
MELSIVVPATDNTFWQRLKMAFLILFKKDATHCCKNVILKNKDTQEMLYAMQMQMWKNDTSTVVS